MALSPQSLARASSRRPWLTVALWLVLVGVTGALAATLLGNALTNEADFTYEPEAKQAADLLESMRGPEAAREVFIVRSESATVDDPAFRSVVESLQQDVAALGDDVVRQTVSFYQTGDADLVSADRRTVLLLAVLGGEADEASEHGPALREVVNEANARLADEADGREPSFKVLSFGLATVNEDFNRVAEEDLRTGETIGILVALVVLLVVFGTVVAALVPLVLAVAAITAAMGIVALVGQTFEFAFFVTNMITMIGLAVGIDYSLFIVSRYREERGRGLEKLDAIGAASATASRAVFFSGMTVVLALLGMLIVPTTIFRSLAAGAIFVVLMAILASLTLLPAILGLLGDRVDSLRILRRRHVDDTHGGFWDRLTHAVMGRPVVSLVVGVGLLLAASLAYFDINTGFSGVSTLPDEFPSKQAFQVLDREFSGGLSSPVEIVVQGDPSDPQVRAGVDSLRQAMAGDEAFGPSSEQVDDGRDLIAISAPIAHDPSSRESVDAIGRLRDQLVPEAFPPGTPAEVLVGGETAFNKDFFDLTDRYTPIVFAFVLGLSFLLLMVVFRSLVVPLKAILLNLLSVGAAYGLIVLVSQKGWGAGLLGFQQVEVVEAWLPLFLFSVLFGLSMDYHVFLLSRIRERYDLTRDNTESVAYGLRTTAGLITGAALIMVAVFGGFATGELVSFQQMGFGLAVAVLLDATIVRSVLVPASMKLLGHRNWYLPSWLGWLPRIHVESVEHARTVAGATAARMGDQGQEEGADEAAVRASIGATPGTPETPKVPESPPRRR